MPSAKDTKNQKPPQIDEEMVITNPLAVSVIFHEKRGQILKLLIKEEMTIIELKHKTGMNPGTIKRHLNDLLEFSFVVISKEQINVYSVVMKYYRATAKKFKFDIKWP